MSASVTIHKFGGAALGDAEGIRAVASIIAADGATRRVVVASALAGVTDALLAVVRDAARASAPQAASAIGALAGRHLEVVERLLDGAAAAAMREAVGEAFTALGTLVHQARLAGGAQQRELDVAAARGERLSAQLLAAVLRARGISAEFVDAVDLVVTDGAYGHAAPHLALTTRATRAVLRPLLAAGVVPVVPGFIGAGVRGEVVTLGRGGSDLTATLLARALGARQVILWKDVPGLLTADPRAVPGARVVRRLHVREAAEIAQYGARVLHPGTLVPLTARTRLFLRPVGEPDAAGTEVSSRVLVGTTPVRAVAATMDQALVTLAGRGLFARPGIVARAFIALDAVGVGAALISQAATEYAFAFTVPNASAGVAIAALRSALSRELALGEIESVQARLGIATVGVVGLGLADEPGVAARVFGALAKASINVLAAAQGSGSGGSLSIVVDATRAVEAQRAIHDEFQLHRLGGGRRAPAAHVDVVLLGAGTIGRELLAQLAERRDRLPQDVRICGVIDRSGFVFDRGGLSRRQLEAIRRHKARGEVLAALEGARAGGAIAALEEISQHALSRPLLVDVTASDTSPVLELALVRGWDVVLANKVPLAADRAAAARLASLSRRHGRRILHEATVGAGLPVIDTLRKLQEAGDRIIRIEGCPSGTLGYLFGELGRGRTFSAALRAAVAAGYAEPDPRIDLSGLDVARKSLILGRLIGFTGDLADVEVESLVPEALRGVPCEEFLARLEELDASWEARVQAARLAGRVLRYRARVTARRVTVRLVAVEAGNPLGALSGTDNQFSFTTARYRQQPLVITGPGAGPAVTAAGVVNDILRLAAERSDTTRALPAPPARRAPVRTPRGTAARAAPV